MEKGDERGAAPSGTVQAPTGTGGEGIVPPALGDRAYGEEALGALVNLGADWLWETDAEHRFTWFSDSFQPVTGVDPAGLIGRSRFKFVKNVAIAGHSADTHLKMLEAHQPFREFVYEANDASPFCRWVSISGMPLFDEAGRFTGYRGIGRNVTAVLASFDELREARRELSLRTGRERITADHLAGKSHTERLIEGLNAIHDAFCYYDVDDRLVLYNEAMVDMYAGLEDVIRPGTSFEALVQAGLDRGIFLTGEITADEWREEVLSARRNKPQSEAVIAFSDGRWIMHREIRITDGGVIGICTDITEVKSKESGLDKARQEAENARIRLQSAIDTLNDGFVLWDKDDRLIACNDAFRRQFSFLPGLREGRTFSEMFLEFAHSGMVREAVGREAEWANEHIAKRQAELDEEVVFQTHDGRWMLRRDHLTGNGDRVGIRTDITEHKLRQQELEDAKAAAERSYSDLTRAVDTMRMGVVIVDRELRAEIINRAFYRIWNLEPGDVEVGDPFRALMDVNRHNGVYDVEDDDWEDYVASRLAEIGAGTVEPREFRRADGRIMIYSVTALSGGKRLISYYDITELKSRETELAQTLEKARLAESVIDSVPNPIFVKDDKLDFVLVNRAFADLFGETPAQMTGKRGADFVSEEEARGFEETERGVLRTGEVYEVEENFAFNGIGNSRIVRKNLVSTDSGKNYVACTIFDVSELKRRELEAEEARNRLADVLESLPAGVVIYDRDDRFVLANRKIRDTLPAMNEAMQPGRPLRDAIAAAREAGYFRDSGDAAIDALYDGDRDAWIDAYCARYKERHSVSERLHPDGRWFQVYDTRTADGTFVGVRVDITELKRREEALKESQRQNEVFQNLIDNVPVSIYAKRPDLRLMYVNKGWCELTGSSKHFAIGRTDVDVFGPDGAAFMEADRRIMQTRETEEIEEVVNLPGGGVRHQIARKSAMIASDGSLYVIGSTTDVTELKQREQELRIAQEKAVSADRAKSEFLANMSHEIRTPMNGVLGMAELLSKSELTAKQRTFTDIIVKSGNALLTIINDILDFSKIDAGQLVLDPAPFNLAEAIEDVATLVSTRAKEKDLELIVRIEPGLRESLIGDVGRLRQVVTNLVGNAVKFTDSGHVLIEVTGADEDGATALRFAVTDTGIGIPEDKLGLVFEKFSQVDSSSTRRHEGTGLGLAITARLVELMGGEIGVESREGEGSTFWFTVKLPHAERHGPRKITPIDVTGARVLVVDDNPVNRAILSEQMGSWSFDSCAAEDGPEAIRVLTAAAAFGVKVDCVVLDYQMPGMTGIETARVIRATAGIADTPIVLLTSVDQSLANPEFRELAIDAQLTKPARSSDLLETLVATIQRYRFGEAEAPARREPAAGTPSVDAADTAAQTPPADTAPRADDRPAAPRPDGVLDILVAEDNEVNQLVFSQILSETGLSFEIVENGRLAVEAFEARRPRMILMDVSMPEMNGLEAAGAIRAREAEAGGHTPIIGVTAHALKGDRERCLEAGMDDYLSKPISPKALLQKVGRWSETLDQAAADGG